jgi:hypothetical protein
MTYDIYAIYKEGAYKVAESTHADHGMDCAQRACTQIGQWPMGFAALIRGEHVFNGDKFTFDQLKKRKEA